SKFICPTHETTKMLKSLMRWFRAPLFAGDEDKTRSALLLNVILNTFLIALPILIITTMLGANTPRLGEVIVIVVLAWITIFGTKLMMISGRVVAAAILAVTIIFIATTLVIYNIGTIR